MYIRLASLSDLNLAGAIGADLGLTVNGYALRLHLNQMSPKNPETCSIAYNPSDWCYLSPIETKEEVASESIADPKEKS